MAGPPEALVGWSDENAVDIDFEDYH